MPDLGRIANFSFIFAVASIFGSIDTVLPISQHVRRTSEETSGSALPQG